MWNLINLWIYFVKLRGQNIQKQWNFRLSDTERLGVNIQE